jgi:ParB family chromosome partitioning protein
LISVYWPSGDGHGALERSRHHVAGEPVQAVVRDPERVLLVIVGDDGEHRTEDLLLRDRHAARDVDEQGGLDPETLVASRRRIRAADEKLGALVDALLDVGEDARALPGRDHRTAQRARLLRITGGDVRVDTVENRHALVVARPREQHPRRDGAALAGVHTRRDTQQTRLREIGVLQHDRRRLAAELEEEALHRRRALLHDPLADGGRAGERDQIDLGRERELLSDEMVGCGDDVDDSGWDVGRLVDQAPEAGRVEGRVGRRLQHDRVPGGQRLGELVDADLERKVPGDDRADHPHRFAPDLPGGLLADQADEGVAEVGLPRIRVDQLGGVGERIGQRRVELRSVGEHARAAGLEDELLAERFALGFQRLLELLEAALAQRPIGRPFGFVEGPACGVDGAMHVGLRRVCDLSQDLLGGRVDVAEPAGLAVDELAVDQHPRLELDFGCAHPGSSSPKRATR